MPLDTYAALQASILSWLARPGDPLVSPSIPDIIELFEREATRRLKVGGAEKRVSLTALSAAVALPADFGELRLATSGGVILTYVPPMQLPDGGGPPAHYTIIGNEMRLGPSPSGGCTVEIVYQSGVPPLSDTNTTNWLLTAHPDCYLFGSLVEAESFIGSDERVPLWAQRREAAFASIESADRKARWGGAPLSIRAEGVSGGNGTAAGDWTSAPPVPIPIAGIVAGDGLTGGGTEGIVTVALDTPVAVSRGGTGAATAAAALANLGGAPLASPVLTGDPRAPTPAPGDADTSIATTAFVQAALTSGSGISQLTGDVTAGPGTGSQASTIAANAVTTAKLANANVTYAKVQNVAAARLLGNPTGSAASPSEIGLGTNLSFAGSVLNATGGASITIADTPPASPVAGNCWFDSVGGQLYIWYTDADSSQWVPASNTVGVLPVNFIITAEQALTNAEELARFIPLACSFPSGGAGSSGTAGVAATGSTTLTAAKNGTAFATFVWAAAGTGATVTLSSTTTFNGTSDVLTLAGPGTADATLAKLGINLAGTRT